MVNLPCIKTKQQCVSLLALSFLSTRMAILNYTFRTSCSRMLHAIYSNKKHDTSCPFCGVLHLNNMLTCRFNRTRKNQNEKGRETNMYKREKNQKEDEIEEHEEIVIYGLEPAGAQLSALSLIILCPLSHHIK